MRRTTLGLAAAAAIAGSLGFGGVARAGALTHVALTDTTDYLQIGNIEWQVTSGCVAGAGTVCSNVVMSAAGVGSGITITGASPNATNPTIFPSIASVAGGSSDFSVTIEEFTADSSNSISSATMSVIGGSASDTALVTATVSGSPINGAAQNSTVGNAVSLTYAKPYITFSPTNDVMYHMDINVTSGLVSVSGGTPVPEPGALALVATALLATAAVRRQLRTASK